ncbi:MAG: response regulator, partial [Coriobacteriales bacterium]|nr:response regulator [Coriobacteriales bacterium]
FSEFEQAENHTSRSYGGTGLGLAISKRIIEMMDGSIEVSSEVGEGSTFYFTISLEKGAGETDALDDGSASVSARRRADGEGSEGSADAVSFAGRRVLLAEDLEVNREIVLALLEPTDIMIDCAENGQVAVEMFKAQPEAYDLILMDIQMPVMDGLEATRVLRALDIPNAKAVPIVAMTANVFREEVEEYLSAGMTDHIGKPINLPDVIAKLNRYLGE